MNNSLLHCYNYLLLSTNLLINMQLKRILTHLKGVEVMCHFQTLYVLKVTSPVSKYK